MLDMPEINDEDISKAIDQELELKDKGDVEVQKMKQTFSY
jgi:hypothetical protein